MRQECRERFRHRRLQRKPLVSDVHMHHGTCATHVPWCMLGSLTRGGGENVPGIPGACVTLNIMYLARGPWLSCSVLELARIKLCYVCKGNSNITQNSRKYLRDLFLIWHAKVIFRVAWRGSLRTKQNSQVIRFLNNITLCRSFNLCNSVLLHENAN